MPDGAVKVDRTTVFGNPFVPGQPNGLGWGEVRDVAHAVWLYRHWLSTPARSIVYEADRHRDVLERLPALAGKDLACWCVAGATCHADVLLDLANRPLVATWALSRIQGPEGGRTPLELTTAAAQLLAATGSAPSDAEGIGSALAALRARTATTGGAA